MSSVKANNAADFFWHKLNSSKEVTSDVKLTPDQFRKMLSQAVVYGYNTGEKDGFKSAGKIPTDNIFSSIFK